MKILIIEDEDAAVKRLRKLLQQSSDKHQILDVLDSVESSVEWIKKNSDPDVAFFDIQLADGPSFEIFKRTAVNFPVIFVTAFDDFAIDAFRVNAIDYLLKPLKQNELEEALLRLRNRQIPKAETLVEKLTDSGLIKKHKRVLVKIGQTIQVVDLENAAYFYTRDKITFAVMPEGKRYPVDFSLDDLDHSLSSNKFFRINRQFIINISAIEKMYAYSKARVRIHLIPKSEEEVIVSTERSPRFKKWLQSN